MIRRFLVFSSTGPGSKELYRKNAEPEQLPTPTKKSFSLSPGAEPVLKEGIRSKEKKRKHSGSGSGLKTIFSSQFQKSTVYFATKQHYPKKFIRILITNYFGLFLSIGSGSKEICRETGSICGTGSIFRIRSIIFGLFSPSNFKK